MVAWVCLGLSAKDEDKAPPRIVSWLCALGLSLGLWADGFALLRLAIG